MMLKNASINHHPEEKVSSEDGRAERRKEPGFLVTWSLPEVMTWKAALSPHFGSDKIELHICFLFEG